jgi:hypothetical protein
MRVTKILAAAGLAALVSAVLAGSAGADVIKVSPGESIQAAIDSAGTYDTIKLRPGTYQENVQIKKDGITLKGAGADETIIEPGSGPGSVDPICAGEGFSGICVADAEPPASEDSPPTINHTVADVRVKNLTVRDFPGTGVLFIGTSDQRVSGVGADSNGGYGIAAFVTTGGQYWNNVAHGSGEAGLYVGDSPQADALLRDNVSYANGFGFFVRDASHAYLADNDAFDNCIGILFLNTGSGNHDSVAAHNSVNHNNAACPPGDEGPGTSGIGIGLAGATRITLVGNETNGNQPSGETLGSGGIVLLSFPGPTGLLVADDNTVKFNRAFGNSPVDIFWDQAGAGNDFFGNRCDTSSPDGLCSEEHGHGGHHGHGDDGEHHGNGHHRHHGKGHHKHHGKHHGH